MNIKTGGVKGGVFDFTKSNTAENQRYSNLTVELKGVSRTFS